MRYFLLLTFSIFSFADDHRISTDFSDCDGKVVIIMFLRLFLAAVLKE